jgi:hypothetical protein
MTVGTIIRFILAVAVLLFAAYVVAMNWACVIVSLRNKRRGIDKHHSTVPLFSLFLVVVGLVLYPHPRHSAAQRGIEDWTIWMLALPLLDIANWTLLLSPLLLIRQLTTKPKAADQSKET